MGIRLTLHDEISQSFRLMRTLFLTYGTKLKDVCVAIFHVWATNKAFIVKTSLTEVEIARDRSKFSIPYEDPRN